MAPVVSLIFCASGLIAAVSTLVYTSPVVRSMEEYQIVPDVIDKAPQFEIQVLYPSGARANLGSLLSPAQVEAIPNIIYKANPNDYFTLIMTDPDAPSRNTPIWREYRHWMVVNIPGNKVNDGDTLAEYVGSEPPQGTGLHRYVFLLYKQPSKIKFDEPRTNRRSREHRIKSSTKEFAAKYNLGNPLAGNFYQAEYDGSVYIDHIQLS